MYQARICRLCGKTVSTANFPIVEGSPGNSGYRGLPAADNPAEIESIRGVKTEGVLTNLMERKLIQEVGRKKGRGGRFYMEQLRTSCSI